MSVQIEYKSINWCHAFAIIFLGIFACCFYSCGDEYEAGSGTGYSDTGNYSFSLAWPPETAIWGENSAISRAVNCSAEGIDTIIAAFYDNRNQILNYPPNEFQCSAHSGSVTDLPVGSNYRLLITCENLEGTVLFEGERTGITIAAGKTTHGGEIQMTSVTTPTCTDSDSDSYYAESGCGTTIDCNDIDGDVNPEEID